jgi:glutathione S-transferase
MPDSPYVRRVAISLKVLGIPFEHRPLSVFRDIEAFAQINPVVKVPTLVTDAGVVLMDSTLILQHLESLGGSLCSSNPAVRVLELRQIGLALAACEKTVQLFYETTLRPPEKQHAPWIERVTRQIRAAYAELERHVARFGSAPPQSPVTQADITTATAWSFTAFALPGLIAADAHPCLAAHAAAAEKLPAFATTPIA